jgi:hypothetical protein
MCTHHDRDENYPNLLRLNIQAIASLEELYYGHFAHFDLFLPEGAFRSILHIWFRAARVFHSC